jgi:WD40 repeat protein
MTDDSADTDRTQQRFQEVLAEYLQAAEASRAPTREQLLARHPELARELQSFFANREQFEQLAEPLRPVRPTHKPDTSKDDAAATVGSGPVPATGALGRPGEEARGGSFGDYDLLEEIARGGMGVVFRARQRSLNRVVALKMILAGQLASAAEVQRFRTEAEAAAQLDHPNIVPIYEVGEHDGQHYFSMKLVEGGSLAQEVAGLVQTPRTAARLMAKVARAVHYAHQRRILHRDLKPANILLARGDKRPACPPEKKPTSEDACGYEPHVTDFGLAKRVEGESKLTQSGAIIGTPSYMAPEQAAGKKGISTAADVYSLGAVLYELLTGQPPFRGDTPLDTVLQVLEKEPARPSTVNPRADRDLETICLKCLEKEAARRYGSAEALAEDLERFLAGEPIRARRSGTAERALKWARRRPAVASLAALVVLVAALGVGGIVWKWQDARAAELRAQAKAADEEQAKNAALHAQALEANARKEEEKAKEKAVAERDEKERALVRADGLRIAAEASAARHNDPGLALLLAVEGVRQVPNHLTYGVLYDALADCRELRTLYGHRNTVRFVRWCPGRRRIVTAGDPEPNWDGKAPVASARTWDAVTGTVVAGWRGYNREIGDIDVSPNGKRAAATIQGYQWVYYRDGKQPDGQVFTDRTAYVWDTATGKELVHLRRHDDRIVSVRFSPDGTKLVTASWDQTARIWDAATGKQLRVLRGHQCSLLTAFYSPHGKRVLTVSTSRSEGSGGDQKWYGHDPKGPVPQADPGVQTRRGLFGDSGSGACSAHLLGEAKLVRVWDAETGTEVAALTKKRPAFQFGHVWFPTAAAMSPDGTRVAVAFTDPVAAVWDAAAGGDEKVLLQGHKGSVLAVAFSPDGKRLATASADRTVRLWDAATGKELLLLRGHQAAVRSVKFHASGKLLLTASDDRTARVWDAATGEEKGVFRGHLAEVRAADFSPDGKHVVTAGDTTVRIWSVVPPPEPAVLLTGHTGALTALAFSPDGKRVLTAAGKPLVPDGPTDETARLWDAATGKQLLVLGKDRYLGPVHSAQFSSDGRSVVTASETCTAAVNSKPVNASAVHVWDARSGDDRLALTRHGMGASAAVLSPDGRTLLTVSDGHTRHKAVGVFSGGYDSGGAGGTGVVRLWDAGTGKLLATLPGRARDDCVPAFSADGRRALVIFQNDPAAHLFEAATGKEVRALQATDNRWAHLVAALSPDGRRVLTAVDDGQRSTAGVWDADTGRLLVRLQGFDGPVTFACFSADGSRLATLCGRNAYVWDPRPGAVPTVLRGHEAAVTTAAFSPDGKRLLTGSQDGTAALWDVASHKMLALYKGHPGPVQLVAVSPDGQRVATGSTDGVARVWPVDLLPEAVRRQPRPLTEAERERYEVHATVAGTVPAEPPGPSAVPPPGGGGTPAPRKPDGSHGLE